jgi:hypothetical protein
LDAEDKIEFSYFLNETRQLPNEPSRVINAKSIENGENFDDCVVLKSNRKTQRSVFRCRLNQRLQGIKDNDWDSLYKSATFAIARIRRVLDLNVRRHCKGQGESRVESRLGPEDRKVAKQISLSGV